MSPDPTGTELLRSRVIAILRAAGRPLTTAEIRDQVNAGQPAAIHHELVYRNLLILENRRRIRREQLTGRNVTWQLLAPRPPLSARVPRRHPVVADREAAVTETRPRAGTSSLTAFTTRQVRIR
jgi:Fe2+ or Zn2+ uptake regulation protein